MKPLLKWFLIACIGVVTLYHFVFPTYSHKFRLSFQVAVDGQVKDGSSVISFWTQYVRWLPLVGNNWDTTVYGPSPWVDLGEKGIVVAAMRPLFFQGMPRYGSTGVLSFITFYEGETGNVPINLSTVRTIAYVKGSRPVRGSELPQFIWLPKPDDPTSAIVVAPDQFSSVIGPGISFVGAQVEITTDKPDNSLFQRLPWLAEMRRQEVAAGGRYAHAAKLGTLHLFGDL